MANDVHRLIEAVGEDKAFVFASSGGAVISLDLAVRHPEQILALVAHEPPRFAPAPEGVRALRRRVGQVRTRCRRPEAGAVSDHPRRWRRLSRPVRASRRPRTGEDPGDRGGGVSGRTRRIHEPPGGIREETPRGPEPKALQLSVRLTLIRPLEQCRARGAAASDPGARQAYHARHERQQAPDVRRDEGTRSMNLTFRGTSDARSSVDRHTRIRIALPVAQAARLWSLLGERSTDDEKRQAEHGPAT